MSDAALAFLSLAAVGLFVVAWRRSSDVTLAPQSHRVAAWAMLLATIAALADRSVVSDTVVWTGIVVGGVAAVWLARWVSDFRLPQYLVLVNGLGGGAALLVASLEYARVVHTGAPNPVQMMFPMQLVLAVGGLTLGASVIVWARMEGRIRKAPLTYRFQRSINGTLATLAVLLLLYLTKSPDHPWWCTLDALITVAIGVLGALRAPDADLALIVAWLTAATGLAAAGSGLVLEHDGLTAAGGFIGTAAATMALQLAREQQRPLGRLLERALWGPARRQMTPPV